MLEEKPRTPDERRAAAHVRTARNLAQGLTLIPYWGYNAQGQRVALCRWGKLLPGESLSQAASRLTREALGE